MVGLNGSLRLLELRGTEMSFISPGGRLFSVEQYKKGWGLVLDSDGVSVDGGQVHVYFETLVDLLWFYLEQYDEWVVC